MLGLDVNTEFNISGQDVVEAHKRRLKDAADVGFAVSQEEVPEDRGAGGGLKGQSFAPEFRGNDLVFGYTAPHAEPMEYGTAPFHPPVRPLVEWAERVTGDPGLGYYVANVKIPEEGIDAQPYLAPARERIEKWLDSHDLEFSE